MAAGQICEILNILSEDYNQGAYPGRNSEGLNPEWPCDPFHVLMDKAVGSGMERRDFIQSCNKIQKRLNIDIGAAALIVLRDNGTDIAPYVDMVYDSVTSA